MEHIPDEVVSIIKKNPGLYAISAPVDELEKVVEICNNLYYNYGSSQLNDTEYDILYDKLKELTPMCSILEEPGHEITVSKAKKVELPHYMGSMDKVKPGSKELVTFLSKYKKPYVLSDKIDGVSLMVVYNKEGTKLYTRGNGCVGQDISHLVPLLKIPDISHVFKEEDDIVQISVRGELVVYKDEFAKLGVDSNARNYVAGIISRKHIEVADMAAIHFLGYEIVEPRHISSEQFTMMEAMGFDIPWYSKMNITMTEKSLESMLKMRKERSLYDIDGIIITHDGMYHANVSGNPKQSKAFKMVLEEQMQETVVEKVEWNISKDGYLKPTIHIQQVTIGGVNIKRTSGFNAKYIQENGIGMGARIILVRSGDVIPHIYSVLAPVKPDMPEIECVWNGTDLVVMGDDLGKDHILKNIQYFIHKLDIPKIGGGTLSKLYDAGYENITLLLHATEEELHSKDIPGLGIKKISDIVNGLIEGVTARPLSKLMAASNIFGRGMAETRIQLILDVIPNILELEANQHLKQEIASIHQFQSKTASAFVDHLDEFREFLEKHPMITFEDPTTLPEPGGALGAPQPQSHMFGKRVLCTGGKPENYDELLKKHGAVNVKSVSKKLDILVVSTILDDMSQASGKYKKAAILNLEKVANIDIIDHDTFQKYFH